MGHFAFIHGKLLVLGDRLNSDYRRQTLQLGTPLHVICGFQQVFEFFLQLFEKRPLLNQVNDLLQSVFRKGLRLPCLEILL